MWTENTEILQQIWFDPVENPKIVQIDELKDFFDISPQKAGAFKKEGMPYVDLGHSHQFCVQRVERWLHYRTAMKHFGSK